jgi:hypothetical protein
VASEGTPASGEDLDSAVGTEGEPPSFNTSVAHASRVYDYWLGGKDNFAADRAAGDAVIGLYPDVVAAVRANRAFLARTVRFLAGEAGIRQFLDLGTGIPTANNTHEVAQSVAPECRVVYVDYDPVVLSHARALLTSSPEGRTDYLDADVRDTQKILEQAGRTLDFSRPVAVVLMGILHLVNDEDDPYGIVAKLVSAIPAGSYLALSQIASDIETEALAKTSERLNQMMYEKSTYRSHDEVARFFDGMELVEPGVVRIPEWRPSSEIEARSPAPLWGAVGRKG